MLFNSYEFVFLFLPAALLGAALLSRMNVAAISWLLLCSFLFYGVWNPAYVALLAGSILFNFCAGYLIYRRREKQLILSLAVGANILLLLYYKYALFALANINLAFNADYSIGNIILPLGISFFTFTQIAFLVDVKRGKVSDFNFTRYALFVTWFPHLIAGPVLHHGQMIPQFQRFGARNFNAKHFSCGMALFVIGLAKKILIADRLARFADPVFAASADGAVFSQIDAWIGALSYTYQLYFDFSGYSDMAIGLSYLFGIRLPRNFHSPYKSRNIIEFWRRWHISLSNFLRDYLYIPLGGNRKGKAQRYLNIFITMFLGGIWHGAGWTYLAWGVWHGALLVINHTLRKPLQFLDRLPRPARISKNLLAWALTMLCVVLGWVVFRATSLESAGAILQTMFAGDDVTSVQIKIKAAVRFILIAAALAHLAPNSNQIFAFLRRRPLYLLILSPVLAALFVHCILRFGSTSSFLYFQF